MFCVISLLMFVSNALALLTAEKPYYDLAEAENLFADFVQKYEKQYKTEEEYNARFAIFKEHLVNINRLNEIHETVYAVNEFSDMSYEEFKINRFGLVPSNTTKLNENKLVKVPKEWIEDAPESLDYRDQNLVTRAKDQKYCASCYVFAGVGKKTWKPLFLQHVEYQRVNNEQLLIYLALPLPENRVPGVTEKEGCIEGQHAKKHKELISLSEQQAMDCDTLDSKCSGGNNLVDVIKELAKQGGIEREDDYPYESKNASCRTDKSKIAVKVTGGFEIDTPTDEELKAALAKYGPLSVALNSNGLASDYHHGVLSPEDCDPRGLDHGVLLVGYGKEAKEGGKDYWIAKNSQGASWGDQGFFYLERGYCGLGTKYTACATVE